MFEFLVEDFYLKIHVCVGDCQWRLLQICHELRLHQGTHSTCAIFIRCAPLQSSYLQCNNNVEGFIVFLLFLQCVLEDLALTVPVCIAVQTLGSNGLSSDGVHTVYRADRTGIPMS